MGRWVYPLDPDCKKVKEFLKGFYDDPMTSFYGVDVGEFYSDWSPKHRAKCKRCQKYGVENVDVEY